MLPASNTIIGVDFGAPRRARDQRRKILAIAAHAVADRRYRVDALGMNEPARERAARPERERAVRRAADAHRLLPSTSPSASPTRSSATRSSRRTPGTRAARSPAGGRSTRSSPSGCRLAIRSTSAHSTLGARAPTARACGSGAPRTSSLAVSHRSRTSSRRLSR